MDNIKFSFKNIGRSLRESSIWRVPAVLFSVVLISAVIVYFVEDAAPDDNFKNLGDAVWWAFVTMTTVGYGDRFPVTPIGRTLGVVIMACGIGITAILTAMIASRFVERRLREGKGMEQIKYKKHLILCNWNRHAMKILDKLFEEKDREVVMINELPEEHVASVLERFRNERIKFVRGDPVHEGVLSRANIQEADVVIVLAQKLENEQMKRADDHTILVVLAVKSLNPKARICCEVEDADSLPHLKRAGVATAVTAGENNDFMLANAAISPGVAVAARELVSWGGGQIIRQIPVPIKEGDWDYISLLNHLRQKEGATLIGIISEEDEGMALDDILSGDMSAIDKFIKKKFAGIEGAYFQKEKRVNVRINPPDDFKVRSKDYALVITKE